MKLWISVLCAVLLLCAVGCQAVPPESSAPEQSSASFAEIEAFVDKLPQLSAGDTYADVVALLGQPTEQGDEFLRYSVVPGCSTVTVSFKSDGGAAVTEGRVSKMVLSTDLRAEGAAQKVPWLEGVSPDSLPGKALRLPEGVTAQQARDVLGECFHGDGAINHYYYYMINDTEQICVHEVHVDRTTVVEAVTLETYYIGKMPAKRQQEKQAERDATLFANAAQLSAGDPFERVVELIGGLEEIDPETFDVQYVRGEEVVSTDAPRTVLPGKCTMWLRLDDSAQQCVEKLFLVADLQGSATTRKMSWLEGVAAESLLGKAMRLSVGDTAAHVQETLGEGVYRAEGDSERRYFPLSETAYVEVLLQRSAESGEQTVQRVLLYNYFVGALPIA